MVLMDPSHGVSDGPRDAGARTLGVGGGTPIATAETDGVAQLTDQEVTFGLCLCNPFVVPDGFCFLEILRDLHETSAVRLLGSLLEQPAGRRARGETQAGRLDTTSVDTVASVARHHVEHVEVAPRRGEEARQVSEALQVPQSCGLSLKHDEPVVTLETKDVLAGRVPVR